MIPAVPEIVIGVDVVFVKVTLEGDTSVVMFAVEFAGPSWKTTSSLSM